MEQFRKHNGATAPRLYEVLDIEEQVAQTITQVFREGLKVFTDFVQDEFKKDVLPRWSPTKETLPVWTPTRK